MLLPRSFTISDDDTFGAQPFDDLMCYYIHSLRLTAIIIGTVLHNIILSLHEGGGLISTD